MEKLKTLKLRRQPSDEQGTLGKLHDEDGSALFFTLELPDLNNAQGKSCIPVGKYKVVWTKSPRLKKYTYEILGVKGRAGIRIHGGNYAGKNPPYITHSLGCPLLGLKAGLIKGQKAVLASQLAVQKFQRLMQNKAFYLEIENV